MRRISPVAVLNAIGILLAVIAAAFAGRGLWVFPAVAAIFSIGGQTVETVLGSTRAFSRQRSPSKTPNAPAAAAVLLTPILLANLDETSLGLFWAAFVVVAVLPFKLSVAYDTNGLRVVRAPLRVTLWQVWADDIHTHLSDVSAARTENDARLEMVPHRPPS